MVAQSAGFCYGVKRAVDMARDTAHRGEPCVMLGSIIHNANVVAELEALGMRKAESWQEVLPGETVVIRSHGEKKEVFEKLEELKAFEIYKPDIVIYDVLGDVVCGGFAMPIRGGYAREVFIVSSGEMMALYAANNIAQAIKNFGRRGYARLKGIILNAKNIENEQELVAKAAAEIETEVVMYVPRSGDIQTAENHGGTVSEFVQASPMVKIYQELADKVLEMSEDTKGDE